MCTFRVTDYDCNSWGGPEIEVYKNKTEDENDCEQKDSRAMYNIQKFAVFMWKNKVPYKIIESLNLDLFVSKDSLYVIDETFQVYYKKRNIYRVNNGIVDFDDCTSVISKDFFIDSSSKIVFVLYGNYSDMSIIQLTEGYPLVKKFHFSHSIDSFFFRTNYLILFSDSRCYKISDSIQEIKFENLKNVSEEAKEFLFFDGKNTTLLQTNKIKHLDGEWILDGNFLYSLQNKQIKRMPIDNIFFYVIPGNEKSPFTDFLSFSFERNLLPLISRYM